MAQLSEDVNAAYQSLLTTNFIDGTIYSLAAQQGAIAIWDANWNPNTGKDNPLPAATVVAPVVPVTTTYSANNAMATTPPVSVPVIAGLSQNEWIVIGIGAAIIVFFLMKGNR
jgi:hypothetical protein